MSSEVVHSFAMSPIMVYSFPSTRLYVDMPIMESSDPVQYQSEKYDCYAFVEGQKYEIKELLNLGISFLDTNELSSLYNSYYTQPMCNCLVRDSSGNDFWSNDEIGNLKSVESYRFSYSDEVFSITGIENKNVTITQSTDNQCYQIHLSFNYNDVLDYINTTYSTNYTSRVEIKCYMLLVINYFYGILLNAGVKSS